MYASLWEAELMETRQKTRVAHLRARKYASLWEAELMETDNRKPARMVRTIRQVRFPLGSGINGNRL